MRIQTVTVALALLLSVAVVQGQEKPKVDKPAYVLYGAVAGLDLASTLTLPKTYVESNPMLGRTKGQQLVVGVALTGATLWAARLLERKGHRRVAKVLLCVGAAGHAGAAGWNFGQRSRR